MSDTPGTVSRRLVSEGLASRSSAEMQSYLDRGRHLAQLDKGLLEAHFVEAVTALASSSQPLNFGAMNDVTAEFAIRGEEPPMPLVEQQLAAIFALAEVVAVERREAIEASFATQRPVPKH